MNRKRPSYERAATEDSTPRPPASAFAMEFPEVASELTFLRRPPLRQLQIRVTVPDIQAGNPSDDELMRRFQAGDEQAFAELYKRRHGVIFTFCLRMCGDRELAKDVFQETFIRIHARNEQYRENFASWSRSIARRISIDHLRKRKSERFEDHHYAIPTGDRSDFPDFPIEQELLRSRIDAALATLPLKLREPFILHEYEEMKIAEIATELQLSEDAVRQRVWRARQRLRELLLSDYRP